MFRNISIYLFLVFLLSSCITNKDLDIFQTKSSTRIKTIHNNTKLSDGDLLYIEIKSLTPTNYDYFNKGQDNSISRIQNPQLYGYTVNDSGFVSLPILGDIYVRNKSIDEVEKNIKNIAKDYFSNPFIKIVLLNFNITVLGEVNNPGVINVVENSINFIEAIGMANGFTTVANRKKIKVIRLNAEKSEIFFVDLTNKNITENDKFFVKSGDIIYVDPIKKRFFVIDNLTSALSLIISSLTLYFLLTNE
tara:strand:+ start:135 stop:878 length:744 start_codon:yes stop_codon:yes gene_type:complete